MTVYNHWRDVPATAWRWPSFSPAEIACRGTGRLFLNEPALDRLQALRDRLGKPLIVRSAYRSPQHNRAVGGATRSKHLDGAAFDIAMANHDPVAFEAAAREVGFLGFGFYPRSGFMHVDLGPARQWGERFPVRASAFAAETRPGQQLQIDFGQRRVEIGGAPRLVSFFVATLGYSRRIHVRAFAGERQENWFEGMESAFAAFGGVPEEVLLDNARALILSHDVASREVVVNPKLHAFARHWGFQVKACAPYGPRTKGEDERGFGYVKGSAIAGRVSRSLHAPSLRWVGL